MTSRCGDAFSAVLKQFCLFSVLFLAALIVGCSSGGSSNPAPIAPTLTFASVPTQTYGAAPLTVSATSASGGAVTYAIASGPATISGSTVTITGAGTVVVSASQAASGNYTSASATLSFTVSPASPTLTFQNVPSQTYGNAPITVSASSASSGAITYSIVSGPATISGSTVTLTGAGTVVVGASQAAATNYTAASASISIPVAPQVPSLAFATIATQTYGGGSLSVSATSASSGAVTYAVTSGPATVTGNVVTFTGAGKVTLSASEAANGNYASANASTSFLVMAPGADGGIVKSASSPISGGHLYLYAVGTGGYNTASTSLLNASVLTNNAGNSGLDTFGNYYVTTDSSGIYSTLNDYTCVAGSTVYAYVTGGTENGVSNASIGLLALLGVCPSGGNFSKAPSNIAINEVSTIAFAYSMGGFAQDATHISSSATALAKTGVQNAAGTVANLESVSSGVALATTPGGNGAVPQAKINTLANVLAACIESSDSSSGSCTTLFNNARTGGTVGTAPTETATAAINVAHNPSTSTAALYGLSNTSGASPFSPALTAQPNDLTLAINYTGGGMTGSSALAVDAQGNIWVANEYGTNITELASNGNLASSFPYAGVTSAYDPTSVAIDASGNVWIGTLYGKTLEFTSAGVAISGTSGFNGGVSKPGGDGGYIAIAASGNVWGATQGFQNTVWELNNAGSDILNIPMTTATLSPSGVAIDVLGNVWVTDIPNVGTSGPGGSFQSLSSVSKFSSSGAAASGSPFLEGTNDWPTGIAFDHSGNAWVSNLASYFANTGTPTGSIAKFASDGSSTAGSPFTGGGLSYPWSIAIDGAGNAWAPNRGNSASPGTSVTELANNGTVLSGSTGFTGGGLNTPIGVAIDGSGNVWIANFGGWDGAGAGSVTELVGAGSPVVTPLVANLMPPYSAAASKP